MITINRLAGHLINVFWIDQSLMDKVSKDHQIGQNFKTALQRDITCIVNPNQEQFRRKLGPQGFLEFAGALRRDHNRVECDFEEVPLNFYVTESPMNAYDLNPCETERDIRLWAGRPMIDQTGHPDWCDNDNAVALLEAPNLSRDNSYYILNGIELNTEVPIKWIRDTRLYLLK